MSLRALCFVTPMILCAACGAPEDRCGPTSAIVKRAVDGDTIELESGERIRYLLVDTNEITDDSCYADEALKFNRDLVEGKLVTLTYDQECTDRFGRLLAYVSVSGREVNTLLLERGYACVLYIAPNGMDRRDAYRAIEAIAKSEKKGMWGFCPSVMEEIQCDQ